MISKSGDELGSQSESMSLRGMVHAQTVQLQLTSWFTLTGHL